MISDRAGTRKTNLTGDAQYKSFVPTPLPPNYEQWIKFFLQAVEESAQDAASSIKKLAALREQSLKTVKGLGRASQTALRLLEYLERNPIIEISKTATALDMAFSTVAAAVKRLGDTGILVQSAGEQRNRIFSYEPYLALLRDGT